jgi:hypothetical protein
MFLFFSNDCYAGQIKETYELQEKCSKRAEEKFREAYGNGTEQREDGLWSSDYTNHYNTDKNKCYVLLNTTHMPNYKTFFRFSIAKRLFDINENDEIAAFFKFDTYKDPSDCRVLNKKCNSQEEWNSLVKPYMEQ